MIAINILEGIADLIVKFLMLVIYIPKTLYKILKEPNWVPKYIATGKSNKEMSSDYVAPVFLYIFSGLAPYALVPIETLSDLADNSGSNFSEILQNPVTFIRAAMFICIPLIFVVITELVAKGKFKRDSIEKDFLTQCYYFSPLVVMVQMRWVCDTKAYTIGTIPVKLIVLPLLVLTILWLLLVEYKFLLEKFNNKIKKVVNTVIISSLIIFIITDSIGLKIGQKIGLSSKDLEGVSALLLVVFFIALYSFALYKNFKNRN